MSKLDDALMEFFNRSTGDGSPFEGELEYAKEDIKDLILETIGEDEDEMHSSGMGVAIDSQYRNKLRAEQRQKVNEL